MESVVAVARSRLSFVRGPSALRKHLKDIQQELRRSTCLVVTSDEPVSGSAHKANTVVSQHVQQTSFLATAEMRLRTIGAKVDSAYPTPDHIKRGVDLARRSGADVVIGSGSGAAMDLAKCISLELKLEKPLILAPATLGAVMASTSSIPGLILDTSEEALVLPSERHNMYDDSDAASVVVALNDSLFKPHKSFPMIRTNNSHFTGVPTMADAALASLLVALDANKNMGEHDEHVEQLITKIVHHARKALDPLLLLNQELDDNQHEQLLEHSMEAVLLAGQLLRFQESVPLILASALLPRYFPQSHILTFMASLLPGYCQNVPTLVDPEWAHNVCLTAGVTPLSRQMIPGSTPTVEQLLDCVDANMSLLSSTTNADTEYDYMLLEQVLQSNLSR